jgi:hypothetical protein
VAGWYLLAPQSATLLRAPVGRDPRPKAIVVPAYDQFSPPAEVSQAVSEWQSTTVTTAPDADHFLGPVEPVADGAMRWIEGLIGTR